MSSRTEEIKRRLAKVFPKSWVEAWATRVHTEVRRGGTPWFRPQGPATDGMQCGANRDFIAHAPDDVAFLLAARPVIEVFWDVDDGVAVVEDHYEMRFGDGRSVREFVAMLREKGIVVRFIDHDQGTTEER